MELIGKSRIEGIFGKFSKFYTHELTNLPEFAPFKIESSMEGLMLLISLLDSSSCGKGAVDTTHAAIAKSPESFYGKEVLIEGYAWGWMVGNLPPEIEKLKRVPMAEGAWGGKNYGTFSDGTASIPFPIAPTDSGRFRVWGIVRHNEFGWYIEPCRVERIDEKGKRR